MIEIPSTPAAVSPAEIKSLVTLGYEVEDMGAACGDEYKGSFRWMLYSLPPSSDPGALIDFGNIEYSEDDAWLGAQADFDYRTH